MIAFASTPVSGRSNTLDSFQAKQGFGMGLSGMILVVARVMDLLMASGILSASKGMSLPSELS
jgi:hypothetical protein